MNRYDACSILLAVALTACGDPSLDAQLAELTAAQCASGAAWAPARAYATGAIVTFSGQPYQCLQAHTSLVGWEPSNVPALWQRGSCDGGSGGGGGGGMDAGSAGGGGGGGGSGTCSGPNWQAGAFYTTGTVVRYTDGKYYVAEHDNPGYDPVISSWFWEPYATCNGGGGGGGGGGFAALVSEAQWNAMFPSRNAFYTYQGLVAATASYPAFATTGDDVTRKREVAAFLANVGHETGDLIYIEEIARGEYCQPSAGCPCAPGKRYYGRGPIQLSWNYNYCAAGQALGLPLESDPDRVARDATVAWQTGLWFWMTQTGAGSRTAHSGITGGSFAETIRTINGALECGTGHAAVAARVNRYLRICQLLGVDPGTSLYC